MRFLSVCSGIEAASVAWTPLGWSAVAFSEIEPFPCALLAHHYPDTPNYGDMTKYKEWPDVSIDLLCGGTPCQSFSVAGLRKGLDDPRGNPMLTFGAIAAKYRPQWLVWENVPGVLSSNGGRDFGAFLGMLGELGYGFAYRVLDAQYSGVAQRRRRVFVVGRLGDWRSAAAVLFERHSLQGHPAPRRQAGQGTTRGVEFGPSGGRFTDVNPTLDSRAKDGPIRNQLAGAVATLCVATGQAGAEIGAKIAPTLNCNHEAPYVVGALACNTGPNGHDAGNFLCNQAADAGYVIPINDMATRHAGTDGSGNHAGKGHGLGIGKETDPMFTLTKGDKHSVAIEAIGALQVRRLLPIECERLMGFPDFYTAVPHRGKPAADGNRYKALGNSWAVPCAAWIGTRIDAVAQLNRAQSAHKTIAKEFFSSNVKQEAANG